MRQNLSKSRSATMPANPIILEDVARIAAADLPWKRLEGTRILISGASGFLPAYMAETLVYLNRHVLAKPARIVAMVRSAESARQRLGHWIDAGEVEIHVQDVCEPIADGDAFDYVIHAASQASPKYYGVDPVGTLSANILGTRNLLELARRAPAQGFLFFSSGDVYGRIADAAHLIDEKAYGWLDCTDVRSCYGESKRMGETMCVAWARQYNVAARIVRPFHTYGPGMKLDDGRVFADFVRDILNGGPITMLSDGQARRCFCYLADATEAFFRVLLLGQTAEAYNVANASAECSIAGLAQVLAEQFGIAVEYQIRRDSVYLPSPIPFGRPDTAKIEALGWKATTGIAEGFARTVNSYKGDGRQAAATP